MIFDYCIERIGKVVHNESKSSFRHTAHEPCSILQVRFYHGSLFEINKFIYFLSLPLAGFCSLVLSSSKNWRTETGEAVTFESLRY